MLLLLAVLFPHGLWAQDSARLQSGVVKITAKPPRGTTNIGTGFIVRLETNVAYIITAAHVVAGDAQPKVEFFTKRNMPVTAEVLGLEGDDEVRGLALVVVRGQENLPKGITALSLATTTRPSGGEDILLIGFPRNSGPWALIKGNISSRQGRDVFFSPSVDSGQSGGPVLHNGKVVGVVGAGSQLVGRGVTARSVEDYIEGFGITAQESASLASTETESSGPPATKAKPEPRPMTQDPEISRKDGAPNTPILVPSTPTTEPKRFNDGSMLLKTCGTTSSTKRPEEEFVGRWISLANLLYKKRKEEYRDLENLMEVQGRALVDDMGIDLYPEIIFTFRCLEKMGYLKLESFDPPRVYGGGKENLKIIFSESRMPIPVPSNLTAEPTTLHDRATLLKMCGTSSSTKRPPEQFIERWVSLANLLYKKRKEEYRDLENLMEVQGRALRADTGIDLYAEIIFTFRCLEKMGYLKLESFNPPRVYGGGKENLKIIFSESRMPIP